MRIKSAEFVNAISATFEPLTTSTQADIQATTSAVSSSPLKLQQAVSSLSATFEQLGIWANSKISVPRNIVTAEQGDFLLFAAFLETLYIDDGIRPSEQIVVDFLKPFTDDATLADAQAKLLSKPFTEYSYFFDTHEKTFGKEASEVLSTTDSYVSSFAKTLAHEVSITDYGEMTLALTKPHTDDANVADVHSLLSGLNKFDPVALTDAVVTGTIKRLQDTLGVVDAPELTVSKPRTDSASVADSDPLFAVGKGLSETMTPQELVNKSFGTGFSDGGIVADLPSLGPHKPFSEQPISVTDVATTSAGKGVFEVTAIVDEEVLAVAKAFLDTGDVSDAIDTLALGKALSEDSTVSDEVFAKAVAKHFAETAFFTDDVDGEATVVDEQAMQFGKSRTDVASFTDEILVQIGFIRAFAHTATVTDLHNIGVAKGFIDGVTPSDSINMVTGKQFYDIPVAQETMKRSFVKTVSVDSALLGDAISVSPHKVLLSSASSTDTGFLRSQGYSDFTYFEEDFVGASTTF